MAECTHDCSTCGESCGERTEPQSFLKAHNPAARVGKVYGIVSGKGGVGKSMVTSQLAVLARRAGHKVGVLDADVTGPSIPKAFGVHQRAMADERGMLPVETSTGIQLMSVNLLLDNETDPVLWRGPVIGGVVTQFWTDVMWGDLDYLFVDMPPGTGDVALTVYQSLPVDGIIIVTSPQELVGMIVEKAVKMAELMDIPVLGIVENMSYFKCPSCNEKHMIFGESHIEEVAAKHGIPNVAKLPMDMEVAKACDSGRIEDYVSEEMERLAAQL